MYPYVSLIYSYVPVCTGMFLVSYSCVTRMYPYVLVCFSYVTRMLFTRMYSFVLVRLLVCTRMYSMSLVCHPCGVLVTAFAS